MDVIRTVRGKLLLNAQMRALRQAGLHQAAARYQLVQAQLAAQGMPAVCPAKDAFLLPLLALSREAQDKSGLVWLMARTAGEGSTVTECAVLLYGALAGWQYRLVTLPLVEDKTGDDDVANREGEGI